MERVPHGAMTNVIGTTNGTNAISTVVVHNYPHVVEPTPSGDLEWVEIVEPQTRQQMYANLRTGECAWEPPSGAAVKRTHPGQWWELFDAATGRYYYYNAASTRTCWQKPVGADIVPLAKLQALKDNTEGVSMNSADDGDTTSRCSSHTQTTPNRLRRVQLPTRIPFAPATQSPHSIRRQPPSPRNLYSTESPRNLGGGGGGERIMLATAATAPDSSALRLSSADLLEQSWASSQRSVPPGPGEPGSALAQLEGAFENLGMTDSDSVTSLGGGIEEERASWRSSTRSSLRRRAAAAQGRAAAPFPTSPASSTSIHVSHGGQPSYPPGNMLGVVPPQSRVSRSSSPSPKKLPFGLGSIRKRGDGGAMPNGASQLTTRSSGVGGPWGGWAREAPRAPLTAPADKQLRKVAGAIFKAVQAYMGERKSKQTPDQLTVSLLDAVAGRPEHADELLALLVRQLTDNHKPDSVRRGWELLAISLTFVSPTAGTVAANVAAFVEAATDPLLDIPEVCISTFARVCAERLERAATSPAGPALRATLAGVQESRVHIFNPPQFGASLEQLMAMQKERFPSNHLPWLQTTLISLMYSSGGERTEGIFRVAADPESVSAARARLDQWIVPSVREAHVPAVLLKQWLRMLPQPLLPDRFYERALQYADNPLGACQLVDLLPAHNRLVLARLVALLQDLSKDEVVAHTKMDVANLALVWAPNVLRCESQNPAELFHNTRKEMAFLRTLIQNYDASAVRNIL